jgi:hypothetical protein
MPPLDGMTEQGTHFLATMVVAVTLWVLDIFDEYIAIIGHAKTSSS